MSNRSLQHHFESRLNTPSHSMARTPRSETDIYATLRRYSQRLKQQRDHSIEYLKQINYLTEQLKFRDIQIDRLNKINRQLNDRLDLYSTVLERSHVQKSPLRISTMVSNKDLTESIIEIKHEYLNYNGDNPRGVKPFEQFAIADMSQKKNGIIKYKYSYINSLVSQSQHAYNPSASNKRFRHSQAFTPTKQNNSNAVAMQQILNPFLVNFQSQTFQVQPYIHPHQQQAQSYFYIFISNSPYTVKKINDANLQKISSINPSSYYYLTFYVKKQLVLIDNMPYMVPYAYIFVSFLPFADIFLTLSDIIVRSKQIFTNPHPNQFKFQQSQYHKTLTQSLIELQRCPIQFPSLESTYNFMAHKMIWNLPPYSQADIFITSHCLNVIQNFAFQLIIDVILVLLLELPVAVISQNQFVLNKFMFYISYIIKPLKYPYPMIFNLTQNLATLLQSPFPTFIGTKNESLVEPFLQERAVFDLDKKVAKSWPIVNHLDPSRDFLMKVMAQFNSYDKVPALIIQILRGNQYIQLQPYWKNFTKTQIYHNYINGV